MASERRTITLKDPIQFGTETITELQLRAPKAKDFIGMPMSGHTGGDIIKLAVKLSGQPDAVIGELSIGDFMEVADIIGGFFPDGQLTGPTS